MPLALPGRGLVCRLWRRGCDPFLSRRRLCVAVRRVVVVALRRLLVVVVCRARALPLVAAWRVSSSLVVVGRRRGACASPVVVSWRPRRRACGGLPSGLCRWPYLACAWRLAPPGCLWRSCRRGPGVRGVSASRSSLWHQDTTFFGVCPTSKALTISLLFCACTTKVKISKWLFCCFSVSCGARI